MYITMVWGKTFTKMLPGFIKRFNAVVGRYNLMVFCFDAGAHEVCKQHLDQGCVRGYQKTIISKFTIPLIL